MKNLARSGGEGCACVWLELLLCVMAHVFEGTFGERHITQWLVVVAGPHTRLHEQKRAVPARVECACVSVCVGVCVSVGVEHA